MTASESLRIPPNFIEPHTIRDLTEEEQHQLLEGIRQRRLIAVTQYLALVEEKKKIKEDLYQVKWGKACDRIAKNIAKIDQAIEKIEHEYTKMKVLRLEAFDD